MRAYEPLGISPGRRHKGLEHHFTEAKLVKYTKYAPAGAYFLLLSKMARAEGFEPPNARTKTWCLTTWRRPTSSALLY